ncbi:MAG: HAMP domain-containing histidine kinase [Flavobacteriaceae bacterium]|nr:HAMP domain-containing histidine kinase [Flavobacteriaceae bacterium]
MLTKNQNILRWIIVLSSFIIISLILWNTYDFFQHFKAEERAKMEKWIFAYEEFSKNIFTDNELNIVAEYIVVDSTVTTPMLLLDSDKKIISYRNINGKDNVNDTIKIKSDSVFVAKNFERLLTKFENENTPLQFNFADSSSGTEYSGTLYYGNSPLLNKLKYYPLALVLIIILFAAVAYFFYRSTKVAAQNKLWTGMAKETAHQIGTPLSSLVGWTEILRSEQVNSEYILEIEKDINRLQTITDRFSKIGSVPTLDKVDVILATQDAYDYLKARSSKLVEFEFEAPENPLYVNLNTQLYSWTIENLVKNAIDAMKGKGQLKISVTHSDKNVYVQVTDTGKGIPKARFKKIFEPGFTSKKRGWGLGLSLSRRIIEDYHQGKIKVLNSELNKGTTIQISLKLIA